MGFFGKIAQIAVKTVTLPIEVVKDIVTLGGTMDDQDEPHTIQALKEIVKKTGEAYDSLDKDS